MHNSILMSRILTSFLIALLCLSVSAQKADYSVVPLPRSIKYQKGCFVLDGTVSIQVAANKDMQRNASFLQQFVKQQVGLDLAVNVPKAKKAIILSLDNKMTQDEGYKIVVSSKAVTISGKTPAGVFYGIQTFRKSLPTENVSSVEMPAVVVTDAPRFQYRGAHVDVSRHFFSVSDLKSHIDMFALHNINRLHWHLTDDQGWRVEIKSLPRLTEVGSVRMETMVGNKFWDFDGKPYGGFFTQDEIREIVRYAQERYITIVPEIDLPGHMLAALTAYPNLGCTGGPYHVWTSWGVSRAVLCAGNDEVLTFLDTVLGEICDLFPSPLIHVGGDECPKDLWKECPKCQARIKALGLKGDDKHSAEQYLQSFITKHVETFLNARGRNIIGWDEILEGEIAPNATVMSWRGEAGGIEAAQKGHDVIMTPTSHMYFDYYQMSDRDHQPLAFNGYVPMSKVYGFEPVPSVLTADQQKHIIGLQCNLWTEYVPDLKQAQYMYLPRMAALSEIQWSDNSVRDYNRFTSQLPHMMSLYDKLGYNHCKTYE